MLITHYYTKELFLKVIEKLKKKLGADHLSTLKFWSGRLAVASNLFDSISRQREGNCVADLRKSLNLCPFSSTQYRFHKEI